MTPVTAEKRITASFWRCWLVTLAFTWNLSGWLKLSKLAWRLSRVFASEQTNMALAAYSAGILINARLQGQYEDPPSDEIH